MSEEMNRLKAADRTLNDIYKMCDEQLGHGYEPLPNWVKKFIEDRYRWYSISCRESMDSSHPWTGTSYSEEASQ